MYFSTGFVALLGVIITMRLIVFCANEIVTDIGSYYAVSLNQHWLLPFPLSYVLIQLWKCDQILFVVGHLNAYPLCLAAQKAGSNLAQVQVPIHASTREAPINMASARRVNSAMGIWLALAIHMIGAEIYVSICDLFCPKALRDISPSKHA